MNLGLLRIIRSVVLCLCTLGSLSALAEFSIEIEAVTNRSVAIDVIDEYFPSEGESKPLAKWVFENPDDFSSLSNEAKLTILSRVPSDDIAKISALHQIGDKLTEKAILWNSIRGIANSHAVSPNHPAFKYLKLAGAGALALIVGASATNVWAESNLVGAAKPQALHVLSLVGLSSLVSSPPFLLASALGVRAWVGHAARELREAHINKVRTILERGGIADRSLRLAAEQVLALGGVEELSRPALPLEHDSVIKKLKDLRHPSEAKQIMLEAIKNSGSGNVAESADSLAHSHQFDQISGAAKVAVLQLSSSKVRAERAKVSPSLAWEANFRNRLEGPSIGLAAKSAGVALTILSASTFPLIREFDTSDIYYDWVHAIRPALFSSTILTEAALVLAPVVPVAATLKIVGKAFESVGRKVAHLTANREYRKAQRKGLVRPSVRKEFEKQACRSYLEILFQR